MKEMTDAIAVDPNQYPYFDPGNRMPDPCEMSRYCSSLVVTVPGPSDSRYIRNAAKGDDDSEHMVVQLAHFSVKEYLTSNQIVERGFSLL
jgi:hypothetical protein